ncbi:extracellular solute-binding protein [Paenibacillus lycopersici]|uniref:Extracellular solute-binding protein n=1 Tax=Paenibacillus lycopersici TaxID=2704462 RepID=A0A6C0FXP6_9BACL|nr:extracellular solute-binding protein [Paenibacillus lycopersici]QHT59739.1 extracellular solute-binding protein [Paenibacillus lycopersici]
MKGPAHEWERRLAGKPPVKNGFTSDLERKVRERIHMQTTKRRAPFRAATAIMSLFILLGGGWWFRDDIRKLLEPKPLSDVPAALSNDPLADKEYALKVLQFNNYENSFEYYVKKPFIIRHPSVKLNMDYAAVDLMQDPDKFEAWLEQEQPDILQLPLSLFNRLAAEGKLMPLDSLIKQSKFDLTALHKPVLDYLRLSAGDGGLYGLPADFKTMALYVNEDLFAAHGVPLPGGPQTMDQILRLAARFQGTGVSGLETTDRKNKYGLIQLIGQTEGLQTIQGTEGNLKATVDSDAWKQVWNTVSAGYREGWISQAKPVAYGKNGATMKDIAKQDPFGLNKTAMTIQPSYYGSNLESYEESGVMKANWSVIPIQLDPSATNQDTYMSVNTVYAINASSAQTDAAWEVLRFTINGEWRNNLSPAVASVLSNQVFTNKSEMDKARSKHWNAFYQTEVDPEKAAASAKLMSGKGAAQAGAMLYKLGGEAIDGILNQSQSVDKALDELQSKLDSQLAAIGKGEQP